MYDCCCAMEGELESTGKTCSKNGLTSENIKVGVDKSGGGYFIEGE